jgi:SsrA-binding protein
MKSQLVAENRKARFDVSIDETLEAGIQLTGAEIKSIRAKRAQLTGSYVRFLSGVPVIVGLHLSQAAEPERTRPLLLHKKEINALRQQLETRGRAVVALELRLVGGWAKLVVGVGTGRKTHDKRHLLRERDLEREANAAIRRRG